MNRIQIKRSSKSGAIPNLHIGELAVNLEDGVLFIGAEEYVLAIPMKKIYKKYYLKELELNKNTENYLEYKETDDSIPKSCITQVGSETSFEPESRFVSKPSMW